MTTYEQGSVVLLPFPFSDLKTEKKRPGVIISSNLYNVYHYDVIAMAITSKVEKNEKYVIQNWQDCGLIKESALKPLIFSIEKSLIIKRIGEITGNDNSLLKQVFIDIFGDLF